MQSQGRYSLDNCHAPFVQAVKKAYRCGSDADAINLLLDFIQDGTLQTALTRIDWVQQSNTIPANPIPSNFSEQKDDLQVSRLAELLPGEF